MSDIKKEIKEKASREKETEETSDGDMAEVSGSVDREEDQEYNTGNDVDSQPVDMDIEEGEVDDTAVDGGEDHERGGVEIAEDDRLTEEQRSAIVAHKIRMDTQRKEELFYKSTHKFTCGTCDQHFVIPTELKIHLMSLKHFQRVEEVVTPVDVDLKDCHFKLMDYKEGDCLIGLDAIREMLIRDSETDRLIATLFMCEVCQLALSKDHVMSHLGARHNKTYFRFKFFDKFKEAKAHIDFSEPGDVIHILFSEAIEKLSKDHFKEVGLTKVKRLEYSVTRKELGFNETMGIDQTVTITKYRQEIKKIQKIASAISGGTYIGNLSNFLTKNQWKNYQNQSGQYQQGKFQYQRPNLKTGGQYVQNKPHWQNKPQNQQGGYNRQEGQYQPGQNRQEGQYRPGQNRQQSPQGRSSEQSYQGRNRDQSPQGRREQSPKWRNKEQQSYQGRSKEQSSQGRYKEQSSQGRNKEQSSQGRYKEQSSQGRNKEQSSQGRSKDQISQGGPQGQNKIRPQQGNQKNNMGNQMPGRGMGPMQGGMGMGMRMPGMSGPGGMGMPGMGGGMGMPGMGMPGMGMPGPMGGMPGPMGGMPGPMGGMPGPMGGMPGPMGGMPGPMGGMPGPMGGMPGPMGGGMPGPMGGGMPGNMGGGMGMGGKMGMGMSSQGSSFSLLGSSSDMDDGATGGQEKMTGKQRGQKRQLQSQDGGSGDYKARLKEMLDELSEKETSMILGFANVMTHDDGEPVKKSRENPGRKNTQQSRGYDEQDMSSMGFGQFGKNQSGWGQQAQKQSGWGQNQQTKTQGQARRQRSRANKAKKEDETSHQPDLASMASSYQNSFVSGYNNVDVDEDTSQQAYYWK